MIEAKAQKGFLIHVSGMRESHFIVINEEKSPALFTF